MTRRAAARPSEKGVLCSRGAERSRRRGYSGIQLNIYPYMAPGRRGAPLFGGHVRWLLVSRFYPDNSPPCAKRRAAHELW